ncbi:MAG: copper chaperone PCu(A)C [Thermomicrobiales bacterium]|nr:copper chaperone PCu(A)C [Thermomicrobiales bacterium]
MAEFGRRRLPRRSLIRVAVGALAIVAPLARSPRARGESATPVPRWGPPEAPGSTPLSLAIRNDGPADRLLGGDTPAARSVRPYALDGDELIPLAEGILIPADSFVTLDQWTDHLRLDDVTRQLTQGETFSLTLRFERAGAATIAVRVRRRVDAAGLPPIPSLVVGDLTISAAGVIPAPGPHPTPVADATPRF